MAIEEFELCIKPQTDIVIWRYMDLAKFEALLKNKALFFCRADRFSDPFEGSIPQKEAKYRIVERKRLSSYYSVEFEERKAKESIGEISKLHIKLKKQYIVNCWHINNVENDSMWQLYLKSNDGVAIKSTVKSLLRSFENTKEIIYCSKVRYLDYEKDIWYHKTDYPNMAYNLFTPIVHKRIEFQQEQELRLIHELDNSNDPDEYWKNQQFKNGKNILIDPNILIHQVYCAPTSDEEQKKRILELIVKYGLSFEVERSRLSDEPYY